MTIPELALATVIIVGFFGAFWPIVGQRLSAYRREREPLQGTRYDGSNLSFEDVCKRAGERKSQMLTTGPLTPHDYRARAATLAKSPEVCGTSRAAEGRKVER